MSNEKEMYQGAVSLRQQLNFEIVNELYKLIEENPSLRFGQIISDFLPPIIDLDDSNSNPPTVLAYDWISKIRSEEPAVTLARYSK